MTNLSSRKATHLQESFVLLANNFAGMTNESKVDAFPRLCAIAAEIEKRAINATNPTSAKRYSDMHLKMSLECSALAELIGPDCINEHGPAGVCDRCALPEGGLTEEQIEDLEAPVYRAYRAPCENMGDLIRNVGVVGEQHEAKISEALANGTPLTTFYTDGAHATHNEVVNRSNDPRVARPWNHTDED